MQQTIMEVSSIMQDGKIFDWPRMDNRDICIMRKTERNPDPTSPEHVAHRLRLIRAAFNLDEKAHLADLIPIDRSSYTKIEKGEKALKPAWAYRIWELFGVPMEYTYRGALDNIPEKLRIAIIENRTPSDL